MPIPDAIETECFKIPVEAQRVDEVSALWHPAQGAKARTESALLLANGAGFHMQAPWMEQLAHGLVAEGFAVLRFNYPYKERSVQLGRPQPPNRMPVLEACHELALAALLQRSGVARPILAGKSMGARVSSYLAARDAPCRGLVSFGYPLHPPKKPEKLRDEHFPGIPVPGLFLVGDRDALSPLDTLRNSLQRYGGLAELEVIEGADHGFHVRKSSGTDDDAVLARLVERVSRWDRERFDA